MPTKKDKEFDFEKALLELEELVEQMEQGNVSLESSLQMFERGVTLTRQCQQALSAAEQKVQILLDNNDKQELADFNIEKQDK